MTWFTAVLLFGSSLAAAPLRVPLRVDEPSGIARANEVITSGVPFARGELRASTDMRVTSSDGAAVPTQTKLLGRWPDGSVQWLLVSFAASSAASEKRTYFLEAGSPPSSTAELRIEESSGGVVVTTGAIVATISKRDGGGLSEVSRAGARLLTGGTALVFASQDGSLFTSAGTPAEILEVEERGPVRATVHARTWLRGPGDEKTYRLDIRYRFFAGQPYVHAEYTYFCLGGPTLHKLKEVALHLRPQVGSNGRFALPGESPFFSGWLRKDSVGIAADELKGVYGPLSDMKAASRRIDGWALVQGATGGVGISVRDFWHMGPKAIELAPAGMRVAFWKSLDGGPYPLGRGRARTHRLLLDFQSPQISIEEGTARVRAFEQPLIATPDPDYFCRTEALGLLSPAGVSYTKEYDAKVEKAFAELRRQRLETPRENGLLHFGDYYHGGYGNTETRGNLEYDTAHDVLLLYARSGDRRYFDFAIQSNQHFVDMDINHETGDQLYHGYSENVERHEEVTTKTEYGHVFVDGPADAYFLTGDERSLEAVRTIADKISSIAVGEGYERIRYLLSHAERNLGWPLQALGRAYAVTGDERYMKASQKIVQYIKIYARDPLAAYGEGKWWRSWMMDGTKAFMIGALHDGMESYYHVRPDQDLKAIIIKSLDWMIDHMWRPETGGFVYEFNAMNRGHRSINTSLNFLFLDAFQFGYQLSGDRKYLAVALRGFAARLRDWEFPLDGKQFSIDVRRSPHIAAYLSKEKLSLDQLPEAPRPVRQETQAQPKLPRPEILLHASFEDGLKAQTADGLVAGRAVGSIGFVEGKRGKAVAVGKGGYAWFPAPREMLMAPGSVELWVRLAHRRSQEKYDQSAIFHVEGKTPLVDTLGAMAIYHEFRVRMKDSVGHLNGTADAEISSWNPTDWHHAVITWDRKRITLYLDGVEQVRQDEGKYQWDGVEALPAGEQTRINLGWRFGNWYCDSAIDEFTVYGRALSSGEVLAKYQAGR